MLNNNNFFLEKLKTHLVLAILVMIVLLLPIFKGGNFSGALAVFVFAIGIIFMLSLAELSYQRDKYWFIVWLVLTFSVLIHAFIYPIFLVNERFFIDGLSQEVRTELNSRHLSKLRMIEVWSFFTSMWLFAWRVSLLKLEQVKVLLIAFFVMALFQALYGVVHFVSDASSVMGLWTKEHYLGDATGTFVNRNHFSGMLAISSPLLLSALLMPKPLLFPSLSKSYRVVISLFYLLVLLLALISSHSRMGLAAAVLGLVVFYYFSSVGRDVHPSVKKAGKLKFVVVLIFLCLFAIWFGVGDILQRYADLGDGNSRFDIWVAMIDKFPVNVWFLGAGPGSFEDVFQIIKPNNFSVRFIYAHNDYLEFFFEFGIILGAFVLFATFIWFKKLLFKNNSLLKAGVYGSFAAVGLHSLVDFNLQIPASAMCFWLVVGLLANSAILYESDKVSEDDRMRPRRESKKIYFPRSKREWLDFLKSN